MNSCSQMYNLWSPAQSRYIVKTDLMHACPYCYCQLPKNFKNMTSTTIINSKIKENWAYKSPVKVITLNNASVGKRKILTSSRTISPYCHKITIRYQSPNPQRIHQYLNKNKQTVPTSTISILHDNLTPQNVLVSKHKILNKKKMKEKHQIQPYHQQQIHIQIGKKVQTQAQSKMVTKPMIFFNAVKPKSTRLFIETPCQQKQKKKQIQKQKQTQKQKQKQKLTVSRYVYGNGYGSTDQTESIGSLGRISIDQRIFQE